MYISVSWSVFLFLPLSLWIPLSVFGYIVTDCTWIGTCTDPRFPLFLSVCFSVRYIVCNSTCIRASLDSYFFLSHCLWMCVAVSGCFITHCKFICMSLDPCLSLFVWIFLCLFSYVVTNCTCIGTSLGPRSSLSFSLSVSVSEYIISNFLVCEQARSARPACNSAIENSFCPF